MKPAKLWTKDFIMAALANLFVALTFYILMTTLAVYAADQFQASSSEAGLAASIFIIGALVARVLAGRYIEVIGRRRMLLGSLLLFLAAILCYFPVHRLSLLLAVRFMHGIGFGFAGTALSTTAMDLIPDERRGEGTGYYTLSATAATAFGPMLGLYLTRHYDFTMVFVASTVFALFAIVIALFLSIPEAKMTEEQRRAMGKGFRLQDFFEKRALPVSLIMVLMGIAYSGIVSFIQAYAIELKLEEAAGLFFTVYAAFLFISRPVAGRLQDRKGDNVVVYPCILSFAMSLVVLSLARSGFALLLAAVLAAIGFGTLSACIQTIAVRISPKHKIGLAVSIYFICLDGGTGIGPFLLGFLVPVMGYGGMYGVVGIVVASTAILYYYMHGRKAGRLRQHQAAWQGEEAEDPTA